MLKGAHIQTTIMVEIPFVFSVWLSRSLRILYLILICMFKSLFCWNNSVLMAKNYFIDCKSLNQFHIKYYFSPFLFPQRVHLVHFSPVESFDHQKEQITTTPLWRSVKQRDPILLMETFTAFTSNTYPHLAVGYELYFQASISLKDRGALGMIISLPTWLSIVLNTALITFVINHWQETCRRKNMPFANGETRGK